MCKKVVSLWVEIPILMIGWQFDGHSFGFQVEIETFFTTATKTYFD